MRIISKQDMASHRFILALGLLAFAIFIALETAPSRVCAKNLPSLSKVQSAAKQAPESAPTTPRQSVSTPDRSFLPLSEALLGHWVSADEKSHFYYREGIYISVYAGKFYPGTYTITETDENKRRLRIQIKTIHFRILTFSADKKEISDIAEVAGMRANEAFKWKYVDDTQEPSADVIKSTATGETPIDVVTVEEPEMPQFIIGDRRSKIYYWRGCPAYETLPLQRKLYFKTRGDAERAGYRAATNCP